MRVLRVLVSIEPGKLSIRKAVNPWNEGRRHYETFILGTLEITVNANQSKLVSVGRLECVPGHLMNGKSNIGMRVATEIE